MKLRSIQSLNLIVILLTITSCSYFKREPIIVNECSWYTPHKITCTNKEALTKEGLKCSDVISRDTKEWLELMNSMYYSQQVTSTQVP